MEFHKIGLAYFGITFTVMVSLQAAFSATLSSQALGGDGLANDGTATGERFAAASAHEDLAAPCHTSKLRNLLFPHHRVVLLPD